MCIYWRFLDSSKTAEENQGAWIWWVGRGLETGQFIKLWWSHPTDRCPFFASCINSAFSCISNFDSLSHFLFLSLLSQWQQCQSPSCYISPKASPLLLYITLKVIFAASPPERLNLNTKMEYLSQREKKKEKPWNLFFNSCYPMQATGRRMSL